MDASKNPAIGLKYFARNTDQLLDSDTVLPRYYQKKLQDYQDAYYEENPSKSQKKLLDLFSGTCPEAFSDYQDKVQSRLKERSDHENYAKFVIQSKKSSLHSTVFREDSRNTETNSREAKQKRYLERGLKQKRDDYALHMKGESHVKRLHSTRQSK